MPGVGVFMGIGVGGGGSSSGPGIWLDASDPATPYTTSTLSTQATADGDPIGGIKDKSGRSFNFTQATAGQRATLKLNQQNGKPGWRFTTASNTLLRSANGAMNNLTALTAVLVLRVNSPVTNGNSFAGGATATSPYSGGQPWWTVRTYSISGGGGTPRFDSTLNKSSTSYRAKHFRTGDETLAHCQTLRWNGATLKNGVDGWETSLAAAPGSMATDGSVDLGLPFAGATANFDLFEFQLFSRYLGDTELASLLASLTSKWTLPPSAAPTTYTTVAPGDSLGGNQNYCAYPAQEICDDNTQVVAYADLKEHQLTAPGYLRCRRSSDNGLSFGAPITIKDASPNNIFHDLGIAQLPTPDLRLVCPYMIRQSNDAFVSAWVAVSSDRGLTWPTHQQLPVPAGWTALYPYGKIRVRPSDGKLILPVYSTNSTSGFTGTLVLLADPADLSSWSLLGTVAYDAAGTQIYNEVDLIWVSGTTWRAMLREQNSLTLWSTTSTDDGATWAAPSSLLGHQTSMRPCLLRSPTRANTIYYFPTRDYMAGYASEDNGASWFPTSTGLAPLYTVTATGDGGHAAAIIQPDGAIAIVYHDLVTSSPKRVDVRRFTVRESYLLDRLT